LYDRRRFTYFTPSRNVAALLLALRVGPSDPPRMSERIVITGIGMITAVGRDRESTWQAVKAGRNGVRKLCGMPGLPDGMLLGATVEDVAIDRRGDRNYPLAFAAAREALADSRLDL